MSELYGNEIGKCPHCNKPIGDQHPYSWCDACGEKLSDDIMKLLPLETKDKNAAVRSASALVRQMETHRQSLGASTTNLPVAPKLAYRFAVVRGFICLLIWLALIELILYTGFGIRLYRVPVVNLATTFAYFPFVENVILLSLPILQGLLGLMFGYKYPAKSLTWRMRLLLSFPLGLIGLKVLVSNKLYPFGFILIYILELILVGSIGAYIGGRLKLRRTIIPVTNVSRTAAMSTTLAIVMLGIVGYNSYLAPPPSEAAILSSIQKNMVREGWTRGEESLVRMDGVYSLGFSDGSVLAIFHSDDIDGWAQLMRGAFGWDLVRKSEGRGWWILPIDQRSPVNYNHHTLIYDYYEQKLPSKYSQPPSKYAELVTGRVKLPNVLAVAITFEDGQTIRQTTDERFAIFASNHGRACELRVLNRAQEVIQTIKLQC